MLAPLVLAGAPPLTLGAPLCLGRDAIAESRLGLAAKADQKERKGGLAVDAASRDQDHLVTAHTVIREGRICTPESALDAAIVLQHSGWTDDFLLGFVLSSWAASQGLERAEWWSRAAWDRALVSSGVPQWFGTQMMGSDTSSPGEPVMCLVEVDPASPVRPEKLERVYEQNGLLVPADADLARLRIDGLVCPATPWARPGPWR